MKEQTRYRKVKKLGSSYAIHLKTDDLIDFGIKVGDMIDISDCIVISEGLHKLKFENEDEDDGWEKVGEEKDE